MTRVDTVIWTIVLCCLLSICDSRAPNVLLIVADDYGWNDVGYHGSEIKTPVLDDLATRGVRLENYYVQPICSPSRSQLLSGRYQIHTGLQHSVIQPPRPYCLPVNISILPDQLRQLGYATHIVGKWHLGFCRKECTPNYRGFDSFYGYLTGAEDYYTHSHDFQVGKELFHGIDLRDNLAVDRSQKGKYSTHLFAEKAVDIIEQHATQNSEKPLFMYLPYQSVHSPLEVPERYVEPYSFIQNRERRIYAGMVAALDEAIGNVTSAFKRTGLWNNTVVIFTTDNGGQVHAGGNNWPLRGWKDQLWEGGVRGVGFVSGPLLNKPGRASTQLVHISDWFPTVMRLAGGQTQGLELDGYDVWGAISEGEASPRQELLHNIDPLSPLKGQRWDNSSFDNRVRAAVRVGDWKLLTGDPGIGKWIPPPHLLTKAPEDTQEAEAKNVWLFNMRKDPTERQDLSSQFPSLVQKLLGRLAEYNATAVPPMFPPYDPQSNPALHGGAWGPWLP